MTIINYTREIRRGTDIYRGTARGTINDKYDLIDALDRNNFGGSIDSIHHKDNDEFDFVVSVYTD